MLPQLLKPQFLSQSAIVFTFFIVNIKEALCELASEECLTLGFNRANLLCSSCDQLSKFDLDILGNDCHHCCTQEEVQQDLKKYPRARLEVCKWKLPGYPQVQAFIDSERPAQFPGLNIQYVRGADPFIKLMDSAGHVKEELAIDKWNTDSVEEFLRLRMETTGSVADASVISDDGEDDFFHNEL